MAVFWEAVLRPVCKNLVVTKGYCGDEVDELLPFGFARYLHKRHTQLCARWYATFIKLSPQLGDAGVPQ